MVITEPNPILRQIAQQVTAFNNQELDDLIELLFSTMQEKNGAGLSAPQLGISKRVFVYGFDINPRYPDAPPVPKTVVINPEILYLSTETIDLEEGCLSVPNKRGIITRCKSVVFTSMDAHGNIYEKSVHDFEARIVQHEIDHLNGLLISDRANALHQSQIS
jgi:peptide deformylase